MKKAKIMLAMQIAAVLILAGCQGFSLQGNKGAAGEIYSGFEGLRIEFLKNTPPPRVFEESQFPVVLRIRNLGAYSITKAGDKDIYAVLSLGVERDYNSIINLEESERVKKSDIPSQAKFYLEGRSAANPRGDEEIIAYTAKTKKIDPQSERRTSTLLASVCYPYKTKLTATVCIDTDAVGIKQKPKSCAVSDLFFDNGQGAPAGVTKIETRMVPSDDKIRPQFIIHIENRGRGEVIKDDSIDMMCSEEGATPDTRNQAYNTISFKAYLSGTDEKSLLDCEPKLTQGSSDAYVKLFKKKDFVRCTVKEGISKDIDAYSAPLNIEMDYGYTDTISANYAIEKG